MWQKAAMILFSLKNQHGWQLVVGVQTRGVAHPMLPSPLWACAPARNVFCWANHGLGNVP